jgi:TonB-linked SusC/RagA family outer membrane protein
MGNLYNALVSRLRLIQTASLVFLLTFAFAANAQNLAVKGKVTDAETGEPLPGTNVLLKGTAIGATTDLNGEFTIQAPADGTLIISFIGYKTQEIQVSGRTTVNVVLEIDAETLSEVVVVGYGTIEKKDATGSLTNVTTKEFNKGLIVSPNQLIVGKVAGLQVSPGTEPGSGSGVRLRGVSINGETPLYVVDGVVLAESGGGVVGARDPLNFINPSDILTINVLKDAQATAIYGARGANGVIIITTKSGQSGKPRVSYDGFASISLFARRPDILSPAEFRQVIAVRAPDKISELGNANTNWQDEVTRLAINQQHNISVTGGVNKTTYYASVNALQNQGVLRFSEHRRMNMNLKVDQKLLNDKLTLTLNSKSSVTRDLFGPNVIGAANAFDPTRPVRDPNNTATGGYYQWANTIVTGNPVAEQEQQNSRGRGFRNVTNLQVKYEIPFVNGLSFNANISYDYNNGKSRFSRVSEARASINTGDIFVMESEIRKNQLYEYYGNYQKQFGKHKIDATLGYAWQFFRQEFGRFYTDETPGDDQLTPRTPFEESKLISFFGRATYDYAGKYLFTSSLRRDGSTRFGPNNRWGLFPAVGFGWRILEENFASPLTNIFTELKFRGSYGVTGNEQFGNYEYATFYRQSLNGAGYQFGDEYVVTLTPNGADVDLQWEENVSYNIGFDASIMQGRVTFGLDYYRRGVNELLFVISPPAGSIPDDQVRTNIGSVVNRGIEFNTTAVVYDKSDFKWNFSFNAAYNVNEITKLDNKTGQNLANFPGYRNGGIAGDIGQTIQIRKVGTPLDAFFVYQHKKNPDGSLVLDTDGDGIQTPLEMYVDQNSDGIINENDLRPYKQPQPKVFFGFTNNFEYRNWDLAFTFRGSFGNYVYNNLASASGFYQRLTDVVTNNIHASVLETNFKTRQLFSDYYVQNASFVKLDNITLGYTFRELNFFGSLRAYVTAQNALLITPYKGVDPEMFNGIDNNPYPRNTTITIGVNATFK